MSTPRGEFRPLHVALWDDPDLLSLSSQARLVLLAIKCALPAWGIGHDHLWPERLARMTGYAAEQVVEVLRELTLARWIRQDGIVLWLRNGLRFEPTRNPKDPKHRKSLAHHLAGLPKSKLDKVFRAHYAEWMVDADTTGHGRPEKGPEKGSIKEAKKGSKKGPEKGRGEGRGEGEISVGSNHPKEEERSTAPNWGTRAAEIHLELAGGVLSVGPFVRSVKPLVDKYGAEHVLAAWAGACRSTRASGKLLRLRFFAQDFAEWESAAFPAPLVDEEGEPTPEGARVLAEMGRGH